MEYCRRREKEREKAMSRIIVDQCRPFSLLNAHACSPGDAVCVAEFGFQSRNWATEVNQFQFNKFDCVGNIGICSTFCFIPCNSLKKVAMCGLEEKMVDPQSLESIFKK